MSNRPEWCPEDVWRAAIESVSQDGWLIIEGTAYNEPGDIEVSSMKVGPVARAIMDERERCAKIVDTYPYNHIEIYDIAAAIRDPQA